MILRKVIIEKYKKHDYVDSFGNFIWLNKYGEVIRTEDEIGNSNVLMGRKGRTYLEAGYVYIPYIPMTLCSPVVEQRHIIDSTIRVVNTINQYANNIASSNFIVCSTEIADVHRIGINIGYPV